MDKIAAETERLAKLSLSQLRDRWRVVFGTDPPATPSRDFLRLELAWHLQEGVFGSLSPTTRRRLHSLLSAEGSTTPAPPTQKLRPGTTLVREWKGRKHTVEVLENGFAYQDTRYPTLSAAARAITGTQWSGPVFFGLKPRADAK